MKPSRAALALSAALGAQGAWAQGAVQEDPRRPPPPRDTPGCEIWEGTIVGNDPSAIAYFQLCGGDQVSGIFLFTSLRSGWSRHRVAGTWAANHSFVSLRDLGLVENHPLNGWSLCAADTYDLRVTRPGHIDGTFDSAACTDHGSLTLDLTHPNVPMPPPRLPAPPTRATTHEGDAPRSGMRCAMGEAPRGGSRWGLGACVAGCAIRRARRAKRR